MKLLITGKPRSGKSTLISRLMEWLKGRGVNVGGIQTPELREGRRVGFEIIDISSGARGILSHVNIKSSLKVSKYGVSVKAIKQIGVNALLTALSESDLIIIDEIGKMELLSKEFQDAVRTVFKGSKPILATFGMTLRHPLVDEIKNSPESTTFILTPVNRTKVFQQVVSLLKRVYADPRQCG